MNDVVHDGSAQRRLVAGGTPRSSSRFKYTTPMRVQAGQIGHHRVEFALVEIHLISTVVLSWSAVSRASRYRADCIPGGDPTHAPPQPE